MKLNRLGTLIFAGMIAGVVVGQIVHQTATSPEALKTIASYFSLLTDIFLRLIKMVIAPLVFSGIVAGLAGMSDARAVGRVGVKSLGWFFCASIVSLTLGLVLSNLFQIGHSMHVTVPAANTPTGLNTSAFNIHSFVTHIVPASIFQAMAQNEVLPILVFSVFFGVAMGALRGKMAGRVIEGIDELFAIMLRITGYVMYFAPIGVFSAIAAVVTVQGLGVLLVYAKFIGAVYFGMILLWALMLMVGYLFIGKSVFALLKLIREPMIIAFSTASGEAAYAKTVEQLTRFGVRPRISSFVLPLAYSFNLDGSMMFQAFASIFIAQVFNIPLTWEQQFTMLLVMMLTSKGIAGVPRAAMVVIAATLPLFGLPVEGMVLLLAIDQFADMGRTATNVVGNAVATAVIAKWEGELLPWTGTERSVDAALGARGGHASGLAAEDEATGQLQPSEQVA
ncbi:MAG: dicarboxylate/amino acid:cation symporter [Pandoraea sp.]|nr:dicarboxylate/amino acid:cation symporter [Pandoraea sp.]MDR3398183.1 dicarboxylate/amino acid:cation symporter [Pandoraea sp.]